MTKTVKARVTQHREKLRERGLRPVQLWVPDTRVKGFAEECKRQCLIVREAETKNDEFDAFMEGIADTTGWG